jgi:CHAT domain-containing protein
VQHWFPAARLLSGRHATTAQVMAALPGADLIHFSCHGTLDARFGYASVLLLAERQELTQEHLRGLHLQAKLVVLSACATGIMSLHSEQTLTLPGQFLAAGAGAVLGTLWHSDELATCLLVWKFYEIWNRGAVPPLHALGDAQEWLIRTSAADLRADLLPEVLDSPAAVSLREAADDALVFSDPWYWANLFIAGV